MAKPRQSAATAPAAALGLSRGLRTPLLLLIIASSGGTAACSTTTIDARPLPYNDHDVAQASDSEGAYEEGRNRLMSGRYASALQVLFTALRQDRHSVPTLNAIAIAYDQLGRYDLSRRYYDEALAHDPRSPVTLNNLGRSCLRQGRQEWALDYFRQAAASGGGQPQIAANLKAALQAGSATTFADMRNGPLDVGEPTGKDEGSGLRIERISSFVQAVESRPALAPSAPLEGSSTDRKPAGNIAGGLDERAESAATHRAATERSEPEGTSSASIAVWNGAGTPRLAARMRGYLGRFGVTASHIANANHFAYATTVVMYRPGYEDVARQVAGALPTQIATVVNPALRKDVVLRVGRDMLNFDTQVQVAYNGR